MTVAVVSTPQPWFPSVREKISGLCSTDCKIYTLLILGRALQAAAITAIVLAIGCISVLGPAALAGLVPAAALGGVGTWLAGKSGEAAEVFQNSPPFINPILQHFAPFAPGQPVGLSNSGNNCWANSALQVLTNVPVLEARMRQFPEFVPYLDAYKAARGGHFKVAPNIDTHQIRQLLSRGTGGQISPEHEQEDAAQLFEYFFQGASSLYTFDHQLSGVPSTARHEPMVQLQIERRTPLPSFEQLLNSFFDCSTDIGQRQQLFFQSAPIDMLIQCRRFYHDKGVYGKINDPIEIPTRFELPAQSVRSGEHPHYECDAFLTHIGSSPQGGHYISHIKVGNSWWYCSDSSVFQVSESQAKEAMKFSYILHFSKSA